MAKLEAYDHLPKPPRGIGMSRRLFITMGIVLLLVMVTFLVFLKRYSPQSSINAHTTAYATNTVNIAEDDSVSTNWIHQKESQSFTHHPSLASQAVHPSMIETSTIENRNRLDDAAFQQASDAPLSVYQPGGLYNLTTSSQTQSSSSNQNPTFQNAQSLVDYTAQNMQAEKTAFLKASDHIQENTIASRLAKPLLPYEVKAGSIIPATLMTGIQSDLPGDIIGKVRRDVFDTVTGRYLLIPQGTTLLGSYDSQIAYGQSRVLMVWHRLIFPNGTSFDLTKMPGVDLAGMAGLKDQVNNHYMRTFGSALLFSVFGALGQLSQPHQSTDQITTQQIIYAAIGQQLSQTGAQVIAKNMNIQPTLTIRPGADFNVLLTCDMVLPGPYQG